MPDKFGHYSYYDTPEGKDATQKVLYLAKWGGILGSVLCSWQVIVQHRPTGVPAIAGKMLTWAAPGALMGAGYGAVTYMTYQQRSKDDHINHMVGGVAAGAVLGGRLRSVKFGCLWMLVLAVTGGFYKWARLNGMGIVSQKYLDDNMWRNRHRGGAFQWQSKLNEPYWTKPVEK